MKDKNIKRSKYSRSFLEKTIEIWKPYCQERLSLQDAEEITDNMVELIEFLKKLDRKYSEEEANV